MTDEYTRLADVAHVSVVASTRERFKLLIASGESKQSKRGSLSVAFCGIAIASRTSAQQISPSRDIPIISPTFKFGSDSVVVSACSENNIVPMSVANTDFPGSGVAHSTLSTTELSTVSNLTPSVDRNG